MSFVLIWLQGALILGLFAAFVWGARLAFRAIDRAIVRRRLERTSRAAQLAPPPGPSGVSPPRSRAVDTARGTTPINANKPRPKDPWAGDDVRRQIEARVSMLVAGARLDGARGDGYRNELTGIGHWLKDKTFGGNEFGLQFDLVPISNVEAEARWRGSDLGYRIVEVIPDEMLRAGFELVVQPTPEEQAGEKESEEPDANADEFPPGGPPQMLLPPEPKPPGEIAAPDDESAEIIEDMTKELEDTELEDAIEEALRYERAFGGAVIFPIIDDGETDLSRPLDPSRIRSVNGYNVFTGGWAGEAVVWSYYVDLRSPKYGRPEVYMIQNIGTPITSVTVPGAAAPPQVVQGETLVWIHESRLIVLDGHPVTRRARVQMRGWGDSIFTRVDRVLQQYDQTWGSVSNLMTDWAQGVLKIEGLTDQMSVNPDLLYERASDMMLSRSIARAVVIGSNEDFRRDNATLSGVSDVLGQFWLRLAAAADMPLSLLVGQVKGGLGDAGATDLRFFYDRIAARQKKIKRKLKQLLGWVFLSKEGPTDGVEPERWELKFNSLWQQTDGEIATMRKTVADTDAVYIQQGVVTPEEVAASRYGGSEWSMETVIDFEGRAKMAADAEKQKAERAKAMLEAANNLPPEGGNSLPAGEQQMQLSAGKPPVPAATKE